MSMSDFHGQWQALPRAGKLDFYIIVDGAQDPSLLTELRKIWPGMQSQCLLADAEGSDLSRLAPHLVTMPPFELDSDIWESIFHDAVARPACLTVIASELTFEALHAHLRLFTEVILPDGDDMLFAFWDPAILGTLVGQKDDDTLHVPGPALSDWQLSKLFAGISAWWYWSRNGRQHEIVHVVGEFGVGDVAVPLKLLQMQVDILVEASVPDHLLGHLRENQPMLLFDIPKADQYARVERHLLEARRLHLLGMQDMLNYICAALIYGDKMQNNAVIVSLLQKVKAGEISFSAAMDQFP